MCTINNNQLMEFIFLIVQIKFHLNENIEQDCMQLELNSNLIEKEWEANWCKNCKFYLHIMVERKKNFEKKSI